MAIRPYLYLLPALTVIVVFFLGGVGMALLQSLGYFPVIGMRELTLEYYGEVLAKPEFLEFLGYTFYIAFVSTLISTVIGTLLAYFFVRSRQSKWLSFIYRIPIAVPHLVAALMLVFLLSQGGVVARLLVKLGLLSQAADFPALFYSRNAVGIILLYMWKEIPFVTFMVYTVMKNIHTRLAEVAANLKASPFQVFRHVILPLSMPSIIAASAIAFAFSFGSFEVPYLLGATYPKTLPVWAYQNFVSVDLAHRPVAMVINMIISLVCALLVFVYFVAMGKYLKTWD